MLRTFVLGNPALDLKVCKDIPGVCKGYTRDMKDVQGVCKGLHMMGLVGSGLLMIAMLGPQTLFMQSLIKLRRSLSSSSEFFRSHEVSSSLSYKSVHTYNNAYHMCTYTTHHIHPTHIHPTPHTPHSHTPHTTYTPLTYNPLTYNPLTYTTLTYTPHHIHHTHIHHTHIHPTHIHPTPHTP